MIFNREVQSIFKNISRKPLLQKNKTNEQSTRIKLQSKVAEPSENYRNHQNFKICFNLLYYKLLICKSFFFGTVLFRFVIKEKAIYNHQLSCGNRTIQFSLPNCGCGNLQLHAIIIEKQTTNQVIQKHSIFADTEGTVA
jgi:hypothetical protein|tara:strand:- start:688 stop:1104 length:417 start_codon:yes stop_codon:yes gene_type:complete